MEEKQISNNELYEKLCKVEHEIGEVKDILLYVRKSTKTISENSRNIAEQFSINLISNIIADELIFRPLRKFRGEI